MAGELAAHSIDLRDEEWRKAELRFWALRWSELEMVGTPEIRHWMRELQKAILALKEDSTNEDLQHNVRWKAECVADALAGPLTWIGSKYRATHLSPTVALGTETATRGS